MLPLQTAKKDRLRFSAIAAVAAAALLLAASADASAITRDENAIGTTEGRIAQSEPMPNPVPTPEMDMDGDGMDDEWERQNGLNPDDDGDAMRDNDADGLSNIDEYVWDADPNDRDTDGDGMDDRWERDHGLMVARNDADKDPDGDGATNGQEYDRGTDPQRADDTAAMNSFGWLVIPLLAAIVVATYLLARPKGTMAAER